MSQSNALLKKDMKKMTHRNWRIAAAGISATAMLIMGACAEAPTEETAGSSETEEAETNDDFLACAVSDEGSWEDKSFNEAAYEGLLEAEEEFGISIRTAESNSVEDFEPNLTAMVNTGCDVIIAVGFDLADSTNEAAEAHPDSHFVTIDGHSEGHENLKAVEYASAEPSYLAGYLAAAYSSTKVVGTYAGVNVPAVTTFMDGFYYGAKAYEEDTGTEVTVLGYDPENPDAGDYVGDFSDSGRAKSISAGQIENDADVIYPVAGGLFSATSEAINESGKDVVFIGVDKDIAVTSPEYSDQVLVSVEKRMTNAVFEIIEQTMADGFDSESYVGSLENEGTVLSSFHDFEGDIDQEILDRLQELEEEISSGSLDPSQ